MHSLPAAILIDLDDTIIDDFGCVDACWNDACAEAARFISGLDPALLRRTIEREADSYWSDRTKNRIGRLDLRAATRGVVERAFASLGIDNIPTAHRISDMYRDLREERARLFPGALETLDHLRTAGVALGLMTNGAGPPQRAKLERFGLTGYFDHIVIEGEFGVGKPHESVFRTLLSALSADPSSTWAVGDNLEFDVIAPMDLGLFGIWVNARQRGLPEGAAKPDRVITGLSELVR
jgi:putative hydrolase of the HAD superfamily